MELMLRETYRKAALVPVPFGVASFAASLANLTPWPAITPDQVKLLKSDNVMTKGALGLHDLAIEPDSVEAILPTYIWRFRPQGQFQVVTAERTAKLPIVS
jgi:NADH dehydrogenase